MCSTDRRVTRMVHSKRKTNPRVTRNNRAEGVKNLAQKAALIEAMQKKIEMKKKEAEDD